MFAYGSDGTKGLKAPYGPLFKPKTLGIQGSNLGFQDQNLAGFRYPNPQR